MYDRLTLVVHFEYREPDVFQLKRVLLNSVLPLFASFTAGSSISFYVGTRVTQGTLRVGSNASKNKRKIKKDSSAIESNSPI
jgi:hypothetical protein